MAHEHPDVLKAFAARYRDSQAGRTGISSADFTLDYHKLLKAAGANDAASRINAEDQLRRTASQSRGKLVLETHPRDDNLILLVRLKRDGGEEWLFNHLGQASPTEERQQLAALFDSFQASEVPPHWQTSWTDTCQHLAKLALCGGAITPFTRDDLEANRELLAVLARVLNWQGESLIRFASCTICGDSKRLEQLRPRLESALPSFTGNAISSLEELGLMEKPRRVLLHGPLRLDSLDFTQLSGPISLSETDIRSATTILCPTLRVLTIENETTFLELAKLNRDTLLIQTSYPNRAVLALLARLPAEMPAFHFGDTDPAGFDILRDLRERSQRTIQPLHMAFRFKAGASTFTQGERQVLERLLCNPCMIDCWPVLQMMHKADLKGDFEQESLGVPTTVGWPFYELAASNSPGDAS